tara:strand:+ start:16075 stop:17514 length:1440 start_codon:yes stop_codon:yes gene_type:complete
MGYLKIIRYGVRFVFLQAVLTFVTIYYFDNYLIKGFPDAGEILINNLVEDRDRFYPFLSNYFIKLDIYLAFFIFIFLLILYSTKFYTYVDELSFKFENKYLDDFINLYLLWTSTLMVFFTLIRFNVLSRGYLIILTLIGPLVLMIFRNSEIISALFGRPLTSEKSLVINLKKDSTFRNLRVMSFRKSIKEIEIAELDNSELFIETVDKINKEEEINLIIIDLKDADSIPIKIENYLIKINKKILLISNNKLNFKNVFIHRNKVVQNKNLTYFNNDIQYGSKYLIKRILDIFLSFSLIIFLSPVIIFISLYILFLDGGPIVVKQNRVGLHGKQFVMYKFRTMKKNSHELREDLSELNKQGGPLFKIENDPRIIKGTEFLRQFSLDELPQLLNVLIGNMSVVGPRPLFKEDTKLFDQKYMRRLNVLPGITGLLQINERNTPDFKVWYKYDIEYIDNWSIYLDLKIILKTPFSLIKTKTKGL